MESDLRYYSRRAAAEQAAAMRAITVEARGRRTLLADHFAAKARDLMNSPARVAAE